MRSAGNLQTRTSSFAKAPAGQVERRTSNFDSRLAGRGSEESNKGTASQLFADLFLLLITDGVTNQQSLYNA